MVNFALPATPSLVSAALVLQGIEGRFVANLCRRLQFFNNCPRPHELNSYERVSGGKIYVGLLPELEP